MSRILANRRQCVTRAQLQPVVHSPVVAVEPDERSVELVHGKEDLSAWNPCSSASGRHSTCAKSDIAPVSSLLQLHHPDIRLPGRPYEKDASVIRRYVAARQAHRGRIGEH